MTPQDRTDVHKNQTMMHKILTFAGSMKKGCRHILQWRRYALALMLVTAINPAYAENASNPLAAVNNTDVRLQYFDLGGSADRYDFWVADGAYMLTPKLRVRETITPLI